MGREGYLTLRWHDSVEKFEQNLILTCDVNTGGVWVDVIEWLKESPGTPDYNNPPYYNFRP